MDLSWPAANRTAKPWCHESAIPSLTNETNIPYHRGAHRNCTPNSKTTKEFCAPTIPKTCSCIQRPRIKEVPTKTIVEPRHRTKARGPSHPHQSKYMTLTIRTGRTTEIPQRTCGTRNYMTIQKSIRCRLLLHQKEKWEVMPHSRLPTCKWMDSQESISPAANPPTDRPTP